jgi:hypothetical protein
MKLITFINHAYIGIAHNLYLQLKRFNLHADLIIYTPSDIAIDDLLKLNLECEIKKYTPVLFNDYYNSNLHSDELSKCGHGNNSYSTLQFLKHDCFYQTLEKNEYVCLLDADVLIFSNFVENLKALMYEKYKFGHCTTNLFAFKYYLNINVCVDINSPNLYHWIGKHSMINTGFMASYQSKQSLAIIKKYCELFIPHIGKNSGNLDEHILTKYFSEQNINICSVPDYIHTLSNCGYIYTPYEIKKLKCDTFHPTFVTSDKVDFIKECGYWYVE